MKSFNHLLQILALPVLVMLSQPLHSQIYVDQSATGTNNGSSWSNAYTDLQDALSTAISGDQIWVAQGTYKPTSGSDREITFAIPSGVEVYGGFDGTETALAQRDITNNATHLSGDIGTTNVNTDNSYTIIALFQVSSSTVLDGFTVEDGHASGFDLTTRGGAAIFINGASAGMSSSPQIKNCIFMDNTAFAGGGAIYIDGSASGYTAPVFENCQFNNNDSSADGGAIYGSGINGGTCIPDFTNCSFKSNYSLGSGGAVFNHGESGNSSPDFVKCNFESNTAEGNGGAMYNLGNNGLSSPSYHNCRFYNNEAFAAGGIYNLGSSGGNSSPDIINCTFVGNEAVGAGGTGGAIYNNADLGGTSSPTVTNCILWGNIGPFDSDVFRNVNGTPTISYSLVDESDCTSLNSGPGSSVTCGSGMVYNQPPLFLNQAGGDLRLDQNSPAINTGDNSAVVYNEDLDCLTRIEETTVDMGAYESALGPLPVELAIFSARLEAKQVMLSWITLSEVENDYFTLERSIDGVSFEKIGTVDGNGTSELAHSYKFADRNPFPGMNYYRLIQIDFDGKSTYSDVQAVKIQAGKFEVYPNPVLDQATISLSGFNDDEAAFSVYNLFGKLMYSGKIEVSDNLSIIHLDEVASFVPGSYLIQVCSPANGCFTQKFEKIGD